MCTCASCEATDKLAGWISTEAGFIPDPRRGGFKNWPSGNPAGKRSSAADYAAHWSHCGAEFHRKRKPYVGRLPCTGTPGCGPLGYPSALVQRFTTGPITAPVRHLRPVGKLVQMARDLRAQAEQERRAA